MHFLYRIFIFSILLSFFSQESFSQSNLRLGVKAGANIDYTVGEALKGTKQAQFFGGPYIGVSNKKARAQIELLFVQSHIQTDDNFKNLFQKEVNQSVTDIQNGEFKINEISIPLNIGFRIIPNFLWLELGPQYTAAISILDKENYLKSPKDIFKSGYLSGFVGLSVELPFRFNLSARYNIGISDRNNTDNGYIWRTSTIQAALGYSFIK